MRNKTTYWANKSTSKSGGCGAMMLFAAILGALILSGCAGLEPIPKFARAGDTVVVAADRQAAVSKQDITVRITDSNNNSQDIPGTDPAVRAWINVYPEPISKLIVGYETQQGLGVNARSWGLAAETQSDSTRNWFETFLIVDLPADVAEGWLSIDVLNGGVSILPAPNTMYIVPDNVVPNETGGPNIFSNYEYGGLNPDQLQNMERADHYTVTFDGNVVPTAVQVDIAHAPDKQNNGVGQAYVAQPRGDINAISWTDDGMNLRVIITPSWYKTPEDQAATGIERAMNWFDFYIAGGITGLQTPVVSAYDENGVLLTGLDEVTATIQ